MQFSRPKNIDIIKIPNRNETIETKVPNQQFNVFLKQSHIKLNKIVLFTMLIIKNLIFKICLVQSLNILPPKPQKLTLSINY